jgi:hypothetical protein
MIRESWRNEMETHIYKTMPRIPSRHFKKIKRGLNVLMNRVAVLFRMINDTGEKDEEFIQETYTYGTFLLSKHIQEKIGKKLSMGMYTEISQRRKGHSKKK